MNRLSLLNAAKKAVPNLLLCGPAILAVNALLPNPAPKGEHVAEIWLTWFFGRGTTLYRQRFESRKEAEAAVTAQAAVLDATLPRFYKDTDWSGRTILLRHEYGINYGVRELTEEETSNFFAVNRTTLPGYD